MQQFIGKKVLITTSNWFYGKDGVQYRGVHGTLKGIHEASKTLGFIPNRSHANWFIEIGDVVIMGCQVMYVILAEKVPPSTASEYKEVEGKIVIYDRPTSVYITD